MLAYEDNIKNYIQYNYIEIIYLVTLQNSAEMKRYGLHTTTVVGHGGGASGEKGMSVNQQKRVLEDIKQYKYQVGSL